MARPLWGAATRLTPIILALGIGTAWGEGAESPSFDDGALDRLARAQSEVADIRRTADPQIAVTPEPDERSRLRSEAQQRMRGAIERTGFTVDQYNAAVAALRSDEALQRGVEERRRRLAEPPAPASDKR